MTFIPQYSTWGQDDFLDPNDATYVNPEEYELVTGLASLIPVVFSGQVFGLGVPWDPVSSWTFENSLDSLLILSGTPNLNTVLWTGYESSTLGTLGNTGDNFQTAFYTHTDAPVYFSGQYRSGAAAAIVWNPDSLSNALFNVYTAEFSVRSLPDEVTHDLTTYPSSGLSCHGFFYGGNNRELFIECHPDGLKVHNITGAIIPGDFSTRMRRVRVIRSTNFITIMTDDGQSLRTSASLKAVPTNSSRYMLWGAHPLVTGATFSGAGGTIRNWSGWFDPQGQTGIAGFEGTCLWDDIKVKAGEATITYPDGYTISWPTGEKVIYTAPWYPNPSATTYIGAVVDTVPITGGTVTVLPQYKAFTGQDNGYAWTDASFVTPLTLNGYQGPSQYIDLSSIPIFNGLENAVRYKLTASSSGGPVTQIDSITNICNVPDSVVDVIPNWKLSSLPKGIFFSINKQNYNSLIPPPHYQDDLYFHNETGLTGIQTGGHIPSAQYNMSSGQVTSYIDGTSIVKVEDGPYGPAWRNVTNLQNYTGQLMSQSYSTVSTGIFAGNLLDGFDPYPIITSVPTTLTGAVGVNYNLSEYTDLNNQLRIAQTVTVESYTGSSNLPLGFSLTGLSFPSGSNYVAVMNGMIQIPSGPGVYLMLSGSTTKASYFLDGNQYRDPKPFSCAAYYSGLPVTDFVIGCLPRSTKPAALDPTKWGVWKSILEEHDKDEFTLFSLTGFAGRHSYVQYVTTGNTARSSPLDDLAIYDTVSYQRLRRDSMLFEGNIRPLGLITGSTNVGEIFGSVSAVDSRGFHIYLGRSGEITATVDLMLPDASIGYTGTGTQYVGPRTNGIMITGQAGSVSLASDSNTLVWGDWNHIGVYQDIRCIGDTVLASDQPLIATGLGINHGSRTSRLYLEINGKIVANTDVSVDSYINNYFASGSVASNYPVHEVYPQSWPKLGIYSNAGSRTSVLGAGIVADFDHVRFGIHDHVDAKTYSTVYGNTETSPTFTPWDAIKIPVPVSGGVEHYQYAHIYRFDHPTQYLGWDDGFASSHALIPNYSNLAVDFSSRGIKPGILMTKKDTGPKGRSALRLGPGQNVFIPWHSFDERLFNGTGTAALFSATSVTNSGSLPYYTTNPSWTRGNMPSYTTGVSGFYRTNSDSHLICGGKFKLYNYPYTGTSDLFAFEEVGYSTTSYGTASMYVGVNANGEAIFGTRRSSQTDGWSNKYIFGPFTGSIVPLETWVDIGIDADLGLGTGFMNLYLSGLLNTGINITVTTGGGLSPLTGRSMGYQGVLGGNINNANNKNCFYIGGEHLRDASIATYMWNDVSVSEFFIGYPLSGYSWPWARFAGTGNYVTGWTDVAVKNESTAVGPLIGTGQGNNAFYNGIFYYPAIAYSGAGQHLLWGTSNNGNDFEGLNLVGLNLYDRAPFTNAESYYALYERDSITKAFGSVDSPIQLGPRVPPEGVNLALMSNKNWTTETALTSFDLSDANYANITNKVQGDFTLTNMFSSTTGVHTTGQIDSRDIRLSSFPVWSNDSDNVSVGYFMHLIGSEGKSVYIANAPDHIDITGDYNLFHQNKANIESSIVLKDVNGNTLSFNEFPYSLVISPYSMDADFDMISGSYDGYGARFYASGACPDKVFNCVLIAEHQTINKTVFIHYPSVDRLTNTINLQDSEIYNPVPLLKQVSYNETYDLTGALIAPTGSFSLTLDRNYKNYNITIYGSNLTGWAV